MKKKLPVYGLTVIVLYLLETSVFHYMRIFNVIPNLLLLYICTMAYLRGGAEGSVLGLCAGLFVDVMTGKVIGFYGLLFFLIAFTIGSIPRRLFWDNMFIVLFFGIMVCVPYQFVAYLAVKVFNYIGGNTETLVIEPGLYFLKKVLPETLYNAVIFPLIYILGNKTDKFFNKDVMEFANNR